MTTAQQNERRLEARKAVRAYLANRERMALHHGAISRGLRHQGGFDEEETLNALHFLEGLTPAHVKQVAESDGGGAIYWEITSAGLIAYEAGN